MWCDLRIVFVHPTQQESTLEVSVRCRETTATGTAPPPQPIYVCAEARRLES